MANEPVIDLVSLEEDDMASIDDFDQRLFQTCGQPSAYSDWALRLGAHTDGAQHQIRLAQALRGVDEPGEYRVNNLLKGTAFAR